MSSAASINTTYLSPPLRLSDVLSDVRIVSRYFFYISPFVSIFCSFPSNTPIAKADPLDRQYDYSDQSEITFYHEKSRSV